MNGLHPLGAPRTCAPLRLSLNADEPRRAKMATGRLCLLLGLILSLCGCSSLLSRHAPLRCESITPQELPTYARGCSRDHLVPLNYALLRQPIPDEHRIGPDDILGICVLHRVPGQGSNNLHPNNKQALSMCLVWIKSVDVSETG